MILAAMLIIPMMLAAYWSRTVLLKLFVIGLLVVNYFIARDIIIGVINLTDEMIGFTLASNFAILVVVTFDKLSRPINLKHNDEVHKLFVAPSSVWTLLMVVSYSALLFVSDTIGAGWDEAANATGKYIFIRMLFYIFYFATVLRIRLCIILKVMNVKVYFELLILVVITLMLREKIFGLFLVLALTVGVLEAKVRNIVLIIIVMPIVYIGVTFYRWLGSWESISVEKLGAVWDVVSQLDLEHGLSYDYFAVFDYFSHADKLLGQTYLKFVLLPFELLFGLETFQNPIYKYFEIAGDTTVLAEMDGSSHPTIYGDSFANFGYLGIFVPALWYICFLLMPRLFGNKVGKEVLFLACSFFIPLLVRGTIYNGMLMFIVVAIGGSIGTISLSKRTWFGGFLHKK